MYVPRLIWRTHTWVRQIKLCAFKTCCYRMLSHTVMPNECYTKLDWTYLWQNYINLQCQNWVYSNFWSSWHGKRGFSKCLVSKCPISKQKFSKWLLLGNKSQKVGVFLPKFISFHEGMIKNWLQWGSEEATITKNIRKKHRQLSMKVW